MATSPATSPPAGGRPARPADLERARLWLAGHGLPGDATALLARRLAVRQNTRLAGHLLPAALIVAVALVHSANRPGDGTSGTSGGDGAYGAYGYGSLLLLTALVSAVVLAQALLDRRVRQVDRRAGAALTRRAAHAVRPGWRTVLGAPRAALAAATFAVAIGLAVGALTVREPDVRYGAAVLLVALCAVAAMTALQLRHVLTHPTVADDEAALTADLTLRVEDARAVSAPTLVWCLPWYLPAVSEDSALGWWTAAWLALVAGGAVALVSITVADWRRRRPGAVHGGRRVHP
ncbi:hypothetical protein [Streptomyces genisteinicus]|uniref:Uncharacterized protein n=1 Tax=Streptomyces genisteinicus TaxID=2768068 RepID=A0A7H0I4V4_9ACTN|nr:hypothetical protein [Streptomyces genisteinicus]QNP67820.1 hypothetical protein IAG43_32980 [Streptomyces genisteinicus]